MAGRPESRGKQEKKSLTVLQKKKMEAEREKKNKE